MTSSSRLNNDAPLPLYHQLADILMSDIRSGRYPVGTRIPAETALAARYGIGRPTARQAVDVLVRKGMVTRRRGSGTFVMEQRDEVDLFSLAGTSSAFSAVDIPVQSRLVEPVRLKTLPPDDPDNPFSSGRAYTLLRLTSAQGRPVLLERFFLDADLFRGIETMDLENRSLSRIVSDRFYMVPERGRQTFQVIPLSSTLSKLLALKINDPVLLVRRYLDFSQADNAVYSELHCPTDRFVFSQTIGGTVHEK